MGFQMLLVFIFQFTDAVHLGFDKYLSPQQLNALLIKADVNTLFTIPCHYIARDIKQETGDMNVTDAQRSHCRLAWIQVPGNLHQSHLSVMTQDKK
jgi:hypothetical protein